MSNHSSTFKKEVSVGNDFIQGDKYINEAPLSPLDQALLSIMNNPERCSELIEIIDTLEEYITDRPDREVIGLEQKLINGGREDLIKDATYSKNKFERLITKKQMLLVDQTIYTHVLATVVSSFNNKVRPLILEKKSKAEVQRAIHKEIVEPVYQSIVRFNQQITSEHVVGMIYFLTGRCHLLWSEL